MRKILVVLALLGIVGLSSEAWANRFGCTAGYWKTHAGITGAWSFTTRGGPHTCIGAGTESAFLPTCDYTDVFVITGDTDLTDPPDSDTLLEALQPGGGGGKPAPSQPQQKALAVQAVACILNATTTEFNQFNKTKAECIAFVTAAYGAGGVAAFIFAKNQLEDANTGAAVITPFFGCPLDKDGINQFPGFVRE